MSATMIYHPGTGTLIAAAECVMLPADCWDDDNEEPFPNSTTPLMDVLAVEE